MPTRPRFALTLAAVLLTVGTTTAGSALATDPVPDPLGLGEEACTPHEPILIQGDEDFTVEDPATGEAQPRPGSGVREGNGTAEDPYVIEGWCIVAPTQSVATGVAGITLDDTTAHTIVRDNVIVAGALTDYPRERSIGILLDGAENVEVRENTIRRTGANGIRLEAADGNALRANDITDSFGVGIRMDESNDNRVEANLVQDGGSNGVSVIGQRNAIKANTITGNALDGLHVYSPDNLVEGNLLAWNEHKGLRLSGAEGTTVQANTIEGNGGTGVIAWDAVDLTIRQNTIRDNGFVGIQLIRDIAGNLVADNLIQDRVYVDHWGDQPAEPTVFRHNNIEEAGSFGLGVEDLDSFDARYNWWGHEDGPSGDVDDACTDQTADGPGEELWTENGGICFTPWLTDPNPDAGAD